MRYAVFSGSGCYLSYALRSIFRWADAIYTMNIALLSGGGCYLYYALRSIFGWWILFILCTTQYFRGADAIYIIHYVVFFRGRMLFILWALHYCRGVDIIYTMHYAVFSGGGYYLYYALRSIFGWWIYIYHALRSIFGGWILFIGMLFILCILQYFRRADAIYIMHYVVFSGGANSHLSGWYFRHLKKYLWRCLFLVLLCIFLFYRFLVGLLFSLN